MLFSSFVRKLTIIAFVLNVPFFLSAQTATKKAPLPSQGGPGKITGTLIDATTSQPIEYGNVVILRAKDSVMEVVQTLARVTGLPVTRSENLSDATCNLDALVEVHAILKAHAVNLEKMVSDIRLLASDLVHQNQLSIPQRQLGSSIMPGKVNPVIPEFVISSAHIIYANDQLISSLCASGCLELNAYLPVIGNALLQSLNLLIACNNTLQNNLFDGLIVHTDTGSDKLFRSPAVTTALSPYIGYHKAALLANEMKISGITVFEANQKLNLIDDDKLKNILKPENLLKLGYSLNDLMK